jgi:hypothetical protein
MAPSAEERVKVKSTFCFTIEVAFAGVKDQPTVHKQAKSFTSSPT